MIYPELYKFNLFSKTESPILNALQKDRRDMAFAIFKHSFNIRNKSDSSNHPLRLVEQQQQFLTLCSSSHPNNLLSFLPDAKE